MPYIDTHLGSISSRRPLRILGGKAFAALVVFGLAMGTLTARPAAAQSISQEEPADDPADAPSRLGRPRYRPRRRPQTHLPSPSARPPAVNHRPPPPPPPPTPAEPISRAQVAAPKQPPAATAAAPADEEVIEAADVVVGPKKPGPETWWGDSWPAWDRVVDAMTARTVRKHTFGTLISHRNYGGFTQRPFHSLFGFDSGLLKVGLGVRFGILNDLDVGILRFNGTSEVFNTYEMDARYNILSQNKFGVDLALRVGLSWFEQYHHSDALGAFVQLLLDRLLFNRVLVGGGLLFHSNSSGPKKSSSDTNSSAALQVYADYRIYDGMSFATELTQNIAGYHLKAPVVTFGPRFITNRHTFSIVLSNSQYTGADGIVTGSDRSFGKWVLGFNITREL